MEIPAGILRRMAAVGDDGQAEGVAIAAATVADLGGAIAGVRLMAPFGKYAAVAAVLDALAAAGAPVAEAGLPAGGSATSGSGSVVDASTAGGPAVRSAG